MLTAARLALKPLAREPCCFLSVGRSRSELREVANLSSVLGAPESSSPSRASDGGQIAESLREGMNAQRTVRKRPSRRRSAI